MWTRFTLGRVVDRGDRRRVNAGNQHSITLELSRPAALPTSSFFRFVKDPPPWPPFGFASLPPFSRSLRWACWPCAFDPHHWPRPPPSSTPPAVPRPAPMRAPRCPPPASRPRRLLRRPRPRAQRLRSWPLRCLRAIPKKFARRPPRTPPPSKLGSRVRAKSARLIAPPMCSSA